MPLRLKHSNRLQALHLEVKVRAVGCELTDDGKALEAVLTTDEIEMLAAMEHQRWVAERSLAGWQYGKQKDEARLLSPYMLPYNQLDNEIREYDRESARALAAQARVMGLVLRRKHGGNGGRE